MKRKISLSISIAVFAFDLSLQKSMKINFAVQCKREEEYSRFSTEILNTARSEMNLSFSDLVLKNGRLRDWLAREFLKE